MAEEQIKITIDKDGRISAKTHGIYGDDCIDALEELLNNMVNSMDDLTLNSDHKQPPNSLKKKQGGKSKSSKINLNKGGGSN